MEWPAPRNSIHLLGAREVGLDAVAKSRSAIGDRIMLLSLVSGVDVDQCVPPVPPPERLQEMRIDEVANELLDVLFGSRHRRCHLQRKDPPRVQRKTAVQQRLDGREPTIGLIEHGLQRAAVSGVEPCESRPLVREASDQAGDRIQRPRLSDQGSAYAQRERNAVAYTRQVVYRSRLCGPPFRAHHPGQQGPVERRFQRIHRNHPSTLDHQLGKRGR